MTDDEIRVFLSRAPAPARSPGRRPSGQAHLAPIWFVVDDDATTLEVVFNTGADTAKGRALRRDPRLSLLVDDERPPFAYVKLTGSVEISEDLDEVRRWATTIGGRYMGPERAAELGARNGVPGELLVRLRPTSVQALTGIAD